MKPSHVLFMLLSISMLAACDDEPAEPATTTTTRAAPAKPKAAPQETSAAAFDIDQIPLTDKFLGEFPFFTPPEGYKYVSDFGETDVSNKSLKEFDRYYFVTSKDALHLVEGKTFRVELYDEYRNSWAIEDSSQIEHYYESAITAAGGVKVFDGKADVQLTYGTLETMERSSSAPKFQSNKRQIYVIRKQGVEVWVEVSCAKECSFIFAQKGQMQQSANVLKEALDKDGHVALYINFDVDKATIRPDSQDIVAEIVKLLEDNPDLKIRIEAHTDNTGEAAHNQTLSENRANAVSGALLAKGIAQNRLEAKGFGATKPIPDNKTTRNQRVEIVKL